MARSSEDNYRNEHGFLGALTGILLSVCVCVAILISLAQLLLYPLGRTWFKHEFNKYSVLEDVRGEMSMDDALYVMDETMSYMAGNRDNLDVITTIDGERVSFFNNREKNHMADCRDLTKKLLLIRNITAIAAGVLLIILLILRRGKAGRTLANTYTVVSIASLAGLGYLGFLAYKDFDGFFTKFHELLFSNNLWLMDSSQGNLINLLPVGFFSDTAICIAIMYVIVTVLLLLIARKV